MNKLGYLIAAMLLAASASANGRPWLIVPGKSIGRVQLSQNLSTLKPPLPEPATSPGEGQSAMGHFWMTWLGRNGSELNVYTVRGENDSHANPENYVEQIRVSSRSFHLANGVRVGASLATIRQIYPHAAALNVSASMRVMDERQRGITFEMARSPKSGWRCVAILVHPKGKPVNEEYLPRYTARLR